MTCGPTFFDDDECDVRDDDDARDCREPCDDDDDDDDDDDATMNGDDDVCHVCLVHCSPCHSNRALALRAAVATLVPLLRALSALLSAVFVFAALLDWSALE